MEHLGSNFLGPLLNTFVHKRMRTKCVSHWKEEENKYKLLLSTSDPLNWDIDDEKKGDF